MRSNHARRVSEAPARSSRPEPDMSATAFSSTGRVAHCGLNRIHDHYRMGYRKGENPGSLATGYVTNTSGEIRWPGRKQDLLNQKLRTVRIVRFGNKIITSAIVGSGEVFGNFLPHDTGPTCQWRGRRRCGPRC
jgi:hypothetical protein